MSAGLLALLDDVAALVKMTATSLDDIGAQVAKTTGKVSGVVIDDAAVTPKYVVGLDPERELAIIWRIARASLINKLFYLAPAALLLGFVAPWIITPILMVGGAYLCFEGYEKVHEALAHSKHEPDAAPDPNMETLTPEELEKKRIGSAVRTDFILSAEIMAITYATVATQPFGIKVGVLAAIAIGITAVVYGFVGLIVKADDVGLHLASEARTSAGRRFGRGLVKAMPHLLRGLSVIGTVAMLWVGAGIIAHGIAPIEHAIDDGLHFLAAIPAAEMVGHIGVLVLFGLVAGFLVAQVVKLVGPVVMQFVPAKS